MADYQIKVSADTKQAKAQLVQVDKAADKATKARNIKISVPDISKVSKAYTNISRSVKDAANDIKTFYGISKKIPGVGERVEEVEALAKGTLKLATEGPKAAQAIAKNAKATNILANSARAANNGLMTMVTNLAKVGFAIYAVKEAVGLLGAAYSAFFNNTIGREIKLQETILKTQATLASTSKVFANDKEITDPYEKIVTLTSAVEGNIESIRKKSLELAGVTSGDVIEVFGMVASQIGQIGGGLDEAEELAIKFSAALGTFGIPLYQARQEIGSILRGDITQDSYLAKALGITNEDVQKAKTEADGLIGFLDKRLAASVAGQKIAATQFAGVVSNIAEIFEEVSRAFGKPLLEPLLGGLTEIYNSLFGIFNQLTGIAAAAGEGVAAIASIFLGIAGESPIVGALSEGLEDFAANFETKIKAVSARLQGDLVSIFAPLQNLIDQISIAIGSLVAGLAGLASGLASITVENIKTLVQIFSNLASAITPIIALGSEVLKVYGEVLKLPFVEYLSKISLEFAVLEKLGVMSIVKLIMVAGTLKTAWAPITGFFANIAKKIGLFIRKLELRVRKSFASMSIAAKKWAATIQSTNPSVIKLKAELEALSVTMGKVGAGGGAAAKGIAAVGTASKGAAIGMRNLLIGSIGFSAQFIAIGVAIAVVVDLLGRLQKELQDAANLARASKYLDELATKYADVDKTSDAASRSAKKFRESIANAKYDDAVMELAKVEEKIKDIQERIDKPKANPFLNFLSEYLLGADLNDGGEQVGNLQIKNQKKKQKELIDFITKYESQEKQKVDKQVVKTMANNRRSLEKEITALRKRLADDEFRYRQRLARMEVDKMRTQANIEMERYARILDKRLEGEEGASRVFLQNLNKYLSQKKRGEDEINQREKNLAIDLAQMDKDIADYKYNTQKQIAKLQKQMGEYEKEVADYRLDKQKQMNSGGSGGTGNLDFGSDTLGKLISAIVSKESGGDYLAHNMDAGNGGAIGIGQVMASNVGPWTLKHYGERLTPEQYKNNKTAQNAVVRGQISENYMQQKGAGYSDEEAARRVAATWYSGNPDLHTSTRPQMAGGNQYPSISSYADDIVARMGGSTEPTKPNTDLKDVDSSGVTGAMGQLKTSMRELVELKNELTDEQLTTTFENMFKGVFPEGGTEALEDQLKNVKSQFQAISEMSGGPMDPESMRLASEHQAALTRLSTEYEQIQKIINTNEEASDERKALMLEKATEEYEKAKAQLKEQLGIKEQILSVTKAISAAEGIQNSIRDIQAATQDVQLESRLRMEGLSDLEIRAELRKAEIYRQQEKLLKGINDPAERAKILKLTQQQVKALDELTKAQKAAANPLQQLYSQYKQDLQDVNGMLAQMASTVTNELANAMSTAIIGVIEGTTTIEEAMAQMFKNIGTAFINMATEMIAKALMMRVIGIFLPGAGGGGGIGGGSVFGGMGGGTGGAGIFGQVATPYAEGGFVNSATLGLIGEAGSEYVIPENKMESSMARWSMGARGKEVVEGAASLGSDNRSMSQPSVLGNASKQYSPGNNYSSSNNFNMGDGGSADNFSINITGEQLVFNERNYISQDEVPSIISQASKQGEARTLRKLRMSQNARTKVGF